MVHLSPRDLMAPDRLAARPALAGLQPPVFLHSGWRTRGTWIWNRLRVIAGVAGYYEPLHEMLASLRAEAVDRIDAESWQSGHRGLDRPYFDAYRRLLDEAAPGVPGFRAAFATDGFFAAPDAAMPELEHYLRALLDAAQQRGEQPVLKFCRSLGRIGWMQRQFPDAVHVVVLRNPFGQFESARRQYVRTGNAYFLAIPLLLLALHRHLPEVCDAVRCLDVALPDLARDATLQERMDACETVLRAGGPTAWYRGALALWTINAARIPADIDLVIDSDRLAASAAYRQRCARDLAGLSGRAIGFDDACADAAPAQDAYRTAPARCLRAHRAAAGLLTQWFGTGWAERPGLACVAASLAEASLQVVDAAAAPVAPEPPGTVPDFGALRRATARLARIEEELAAVHASRSWRITAPVRWVSRRLHAPPIAARSAR
jgi:hypothetical protein